MKNFGTVLLAFAGICTGSVVSLASGTIQVKEVKLNEKAIAALPTSS